MVIKKIERECHRSRHYMSVNGTRILLEIINYHSYLPTARERGNFFLYMTQPALVYPERNHTPSQHARSVSKFFYSSNKPKPTFESRASCLNAVYYKYAHVWFGAETMVYGQELYCTTASIFIFPFLLWGSTTWAGVEIKYSCQSLGRMSHKGRRD